VASQSALVSTPQAQVSKQQEFPVLATLGKYTIYPMEWCTEDQIAKLFSKVCQHGNPVLQGRPAADLRLLGRAMYRKANLLRLGQVAVHKGEPVAMYVSWDVATGGVWQDSGLEMPASMAAHAACGKGAFDLLKARGSRGKTLFSAFGGVLPGHDAVLFCHFGVCSFMMAKELGFEDGFQFSLLPTMHKRAGGVFAKFGPDKANKQWDLSFDEVADGTADKAVADQIRETGGKLSISLTNIDWALTGEGDEWMKRAAATVRLANADGTRGPSQLMATKHMNWMRQTIFNPAQLDKAAALLDDDESEDLGARCTNGMASVQYGKERTCGHCGLNLVACSMRCDPACYTTVPSWAAARTSWL